MIAVAVDVGQGGEDLEDDPQARAGLRRRRGRTWPTPGTSSPTSTACPHCRRNALYMDRYPLVSALSRPLIVKHLVDAAQAVRRDDRGARLHRQGQRPGPLRGRHPGARARAEGASPRSATSAWTRDKAIAVRRGPRSADRDQQAVAVLDRPERLGPRGRDRLPRGHLERPDRGRLRLHAQPGAAARAGRGRHLVRAAACRSRSTAQPVTLLQAIQELNAARGAQGVGRLDMVEDRLVGIKSREVYEAPGAIALHHRAPGAGERHGRARPRPVQAHRRPALGRAGLRRPVVLPAQARRSTRSSRPPSEYVSGDVRMTLHGGRAVPTGRRSDASLYDFDLATYDTGDTFDQSPREGLRPAVGPAAARSRRAAPSACSDRRCRRRAHRRDQRGDRRDGLWGGRFAAGPADALAALSSPRTSTGGSPRTTCGPRWRTPACCTAPGCSTTTSSPACSTRWSSSTPTSPPARSAPAPDDEDVHTALERGLLERAGAELGGKLRAGRSRNDQIATLFRMYSARRRPPGRRGRVSTSSTRWSPRRRPTWTRRCRVAPTCSTPSRCCSRTTCWRTRRRSCATSSGCATGTGARRCRRYGSGALAGSSLGLDPEAVAAELGFAGRPPTRSTARPRATSSRSSPFVPR